eukprot:270971_1
MSVQIFVKYWTPFLEIITLDVEPNDTILNVKRQIQQITNIATCEQHLNKSQWGFWKPLVDEYILSEHGIKNQSTLMFVYNPCAAKMRAEKYQNDIVNKEESSDSPQSSDIEPTSNPDMEDVKHVQFVESSNDLSEIKQIIQSFILEIKQSISEIKQSLSEKTRKPTLELMNNDGKIQQMVIDGYIREYNQSKQSDHVAEDINNLVGFYYKQLSMMSKQNKMVTNNKENFKRHLDVPNELQNQYIMIQNVGIRNNGNKKQITLNFFNGNFRFRFTSNLCN